jgi:hypothetical protein
LYRTGQDRSWRDGVHKNFFCGQTASQILRDAGERRFRRRICNEPRTLVFDRQGGDVDYSTPRSLPHQRKGMPNTPDRGKNTLIERVMPSFVREIGESSGPCGTHSVNQRIYVAPAIRNRCERIRHLSIVSRVRGDGEYLRGSGVANLLEGLIEDF